MSRIDKAIRAYKAKKARQGELNRQAGYRFENLVYNFLKRNYKYVINSSGSRGVADLRAWREDGTEIIVSCKTNGYWTQSELKELRELRDWKTKYGRREIKLAYYTNKKTWTLRTFK